MRFLPFLLCPLLLAQDTTGVGGLTGTVTSADGKPASQVKVCVVDSPRCVTSDDRGQFRFPDLRPGDYQLDITAPGQPSIRSSAVSVRAGLDGTVEVSLSAATAVQQTLTVTESVFVAPEEIKSSSYVIQSEELFKSAGARQDISRYVQLLPGVVTGANDFRNDIIVRGGSPLENLFIVDNIEIPNINAFANFASAGGTTSILDAQLIRDVTFLTGGQPAPFINRTSSVLQVAQTEGSRDRFRGRVTVGDPGIGGIVEGPINKGKGSWIVSARRSYLDLFTKDIGIGGVPVLYTYNAKVLYDLTPRDRIWAASISGSDDIRLGLRDDVKRDAKFETEELNNLDIRYGGWRSANGLNWQRLYGARGVGLLGVTHSEARVDQSVRDLLRRGIPSATAKADDIIAASPVVFREKSREGETTLKYDFTGYLPMLDKLQAGGSFKIFQVNYNSAAPFGSDSPYSAVRDVNPFDIRQSFSARQSSAYLQSSRNLGSRWNLTWGGRIDNYQYIARSRFSPRVGLSFRITDKLSWRASFGTYFQQPQFLFLAAFPQNRNLTPFRAEHYVTGFTYIPTATLRFTVEAYLKQYKDYPVSTQFPALSLASIGDTFQIREILFPLTSAGRGRARGIEFFVEKKWGARWFGNANLSLSQARQGGLDGILRPSTFDFPVIFNSLGGYRFNKKWEVSARTTITSGRPYTPFNTALSTQQRRGIFDLARVNDLRVPAYIRIDLRVDRTFMVRDKPLLVFLGAQNVINRTNVSGFEWARRANQPVANEQLGLFPVIGLNWFF
ncbi:MAG: TonB-dependent receptor [Acidobacteria bacterium]|nr:TonB-dependent receptor [Acidobacteriota bacterium]